MTVTKILAQAQALTPEERKELLKRLIDMMDVEVTPKPKTGAEIAAYLEGLPPVELIDDHIDDAVEWVKTQRRKRQDYIQSLQDEQS